MNRKKNVQIIMNANEFSLDELLQIQSEIIRVTERLPKVEPCDIHPDNIFLRVYLNKLGLNDFKYESQVCVSRLQGNSSAQLAYRTYTSEDFR